MAPMIKLRIDVLGDFLWMAPPKGSQPQRYIEKEEFTTIRLCEVLSVGFDVSKPFGG